MFANFAEGVLNFFVVRQKSAVDIEILRQRKNGTAKRMPTNCRRSTIANIQNNPLEEVITEAHLEMKFTVSGHSYVYWSFLRY